MSKRAERRHHRRRMIRKALHYGVCCSDPKRARKMVDYLCICSCNLCRNPRRTSWNQGQHRWTIQEKKSFAAFQEMKIELDLDSIQDPEE